MTERITNQVALPPFHSSTTDQGGPNNRSPRTYEGRRRRAQYIFVVPIAGDPEPLERRQSWRSSSLIVGKLAGSRDNAKRFLKSIIASNYAQPSKDCSSSRRRSFIPDQITPGSSGRPESQVEPEESTMRSSASDLTAGPVASMVTRPALVESVRVQPSTSWSNKPIATISSKVVPDEKPLAAGNGITVAIALAEPVLFLQGYEPTDDSERNTAMLRGSLHLKVSKSTKIKAVSLNFCGKAITKWPEGIPPKKVEFEERDIIMRHTWPFFNAQFPSAEMNTGADHVELSKTNSNLQTTLSPFDSSWRESSANLANTLTPREQKRLSLQSNHSRSRSFGRGESSINGPSVAQRGYRTFHPGDYVYNFELPIDSHLPETIDVELGCVKYELEAIVERAGAFRANLIGAKEVTLIRTPSEGSLEQVEPIAISRNWEDQLHYDIVISGKSFPLGAQVPIAFKLTPLAKVQCHRIKVFLTENIEYFCHQKRVHRMEPTRKIQLFEKRADSAPTTTYPGSTMRIISGGGVPYDYRAAASRGEDVPLQDPTNLLGNLDGGSNIGPTEMEFSVQLPRCHNMRDKDKMQRLHFDTTYANIQVHHWIKIVMRLSRLDHNDPTKRRHFEISIDSPLHILSCRATQANTSLPAYSSPESASDDTRLPECGCPGAAVRRNSPTSFVSTLNSLNGSREVGQDTSTDLPRPARAHLVGPTNPHVQRPVHMLRAPSFNPPAFEDEEPPPPLETPPPQYDTIASPTSGLSDYFSRLSDAYEDESENEGGPSRMSLPLTPGTRVNRSMDERRTWAPISGQ